MFCHLAIESEKRIQICRFGTFGRAPVVPLHARLEETLKTLVSIVGYPPCWKQFVIPLTTYSEDDPSMTLVLGLVLGLCIDSLGLGEEFQP